MTTATEPATVRTVADVNLPDLALRRIPDLRKVAGTGGGEWHGPCPSCGGTDRFVVNGSGGKDGRGLFWCRACDASGDAVDLIKLLDACDTASAFQSLGIGRSDWRPTHQTLQPPTPQEPVEPPPALWRARASDWLVAAEATLWSPMGAKALAYLHSRGLTDDTIRDARLGYSPDDSLALRSEWGIDDTAAGSFAVTKLTIPRGIVLPYLVQGEPWRIEVRRPVTAHDVCCAKGAMLLTAGNDATGQIWRALRSVSFASPARLAALTGLALDSVIECLAWLRSRQLLDTPAKYLAIAGSANTVYGVDSWQPGRAGVLVEGVLNALSVRRTVPGVNVAALGAATHGRKVKWVMQLGRWTGVLVALDSEADTDKAATIEQAAHWWVDALAPTALRWRPLANDCNAMLIGGHDLAAWVAAGMERLQQPETPHTAATAVCGACGATLPVATAELCAACATPAPQWRGVDGIEQRQDWNAVFTSPDPAPIAPKAVPSQSADYWRDELSTRLANAPPELDTTWQQYMDAKGTADEGALRLMLTGSLDGRWLLRTYTEWQQATQGA